VAIVTWHAQWIDFKQSAQVTPNEPPHPSPPGPLPFEGRGSTMEAKFMTDASP